MNTTYNPKWVLIINNIDNKPISIRKYELKQDALQDLRYHTELGYYVTMVANSVWVNRHIIDKTKEYQNGKA